MQADNLKMELERIINDLGKVEGVDGSLIVNGQGNILSHRILKNIHIGLFGPMAHVITSSSKRLLNSSNQGQIQRVLVESEHGKALFLHLGNVHFIVLMNKNANVGLILVSSKRAAEKIVELTKDLETVPEEVKIDEPVQIETEVLNESGPFIDTDAIEKTVVKEVISEPELNLKTPIQPNSEIAEDLEAELNIDNTGVQVEESKEISEEHIVEENEMGESTKPKMSIPVIKPPIAFPDLKTVVEVPNNIDERAELILDIYEAIFRAMSIGASKIMGVAPARGLTQKFLPSENCKKLLDGVNVKSNSTIDFNKIRENAMKIPVEERESQFIEDFTKIIEVVTDNYGKVMGYGAFRGMVRPEFKIITESYGIVMDKLGIKDKMHREMAELFK
jgi:predicted regulator of Ras-like GTPase activity (Roadblock/LC7/MglB family)